MTPFRIVAGSAFVSALALMCAAPPSAHATVTQFETAAPPASFILAGTQPRKALAQPRGAMDSARAPVGIATTTGPGQSGYVHFFIIETADGERETQVGIEMPDGRIAWSFPEVGVAVVPFIEAGEIEVNGRVYAVRHRYGIRPFPGERAMQVLRQELPQRVLPWVEDATPYCNTTESPPHLCVSCLGFVLRVLYPGRTPAYPALPMDFRNAGSNPWYSTDDLLLYLAGLHTVSKADARVKRIEALALPPALREDLLALAGPVDAGNAAAPASKTLSEKMRSGVRSYTRTPPQRKRL